MTYKACRISNPAGLFEVKMRIDKYLKVSRIIKRRSVANEACSSGRVMIDNKTAKPGTEVRPGNIISIRFGEHIGLYEVVSIFETARKEQAHEMYRIIREDNTLQAERNAE